MSKGGAGKVYFVLYLAVILELLIIIVERDEAEEHLLAKQKESMKIVQSILSQLQVGAGVEGISTRPQDQIVLKDASWANQPGMNLIKEERQYLVEVGVTDVLGDISKILKDDRLAPEEKQRRLKDFSIASNVRDLQFQIWYTPTKDSVPRFPTDSAIAEEISKMGEGFQEITPEGYNWTLLGAQSMKYNNEATIAQKAIPLDARGTVEWWRDVSPIYELGAPKGAITQFAPPNMTQFRYTHDTTMRDGTNHWPSSLKVRTFLVSFKPAGGREGTYKLHFFSKTNKIMGIRPDRASKMEEVSDDDVVNIGTVQLSVKDLRSVLRELERTMQDAKTREATAALDAGKMTVAQYRDTYINRVRDLEVTAPDEAGRVRLYGAINLILRPGASEELDPNKSSMGFTVRVVKPNIPTADPKIADLRTVVRVFDKLSKIVLPFQVSPANGTTELTKKPGAANVVAGSGAVAASGGGQQQWVPRNFEIPVAGSLAPRDEPYVFELVQSTSGKRSEPVQCSVYVYPSKLSNESDVTSSLEASWGDNIELVAIPSSGATIKDDEFVMNFSMGGGSQTPALRKLKVTGGDNLVVPAGADKVSLTVGWKDPQTGEVVSLYEGSGEVGLKKPFVTTNDAKSEPIMNNQDPEFKVRGIIIKPPTIGGDEKAEIGDVSVTVASATVRGMTSDQSYRVAVVGKPRKVSGQEYEVTLKLTGGKIPLKKGDVKGNVTLTVSASASAQGASSRPRQKTFTVSVSN
jgi:hypothetical protein